VSAPNVRGDQVGENPPACLLLPACVPAATRTLFEERQFGSNVDTPAAWTMLLPPNWSLFQIPFLVGVISNKHHWGNSPERRGKGKGKADSSGSLSHPCLRTPQHRRAVANRRTSRFPTHTLAASHTNIAQTVHQQIILLYDIPLLVPPVKTVLLTPATETPSGDPIGFAVRLHRPPSARNPRPGPDPAPTPDTYAVD
jgi:hypothetical protein